MWEYRLIWTRRGPAWWDEAWASARAVLQQRGREPEHRPDTYLVLPDRPDVGLKLRGTDGQFEVKVRHESDAGWELWEKIPCYEWNDLEAARLAVLLQRDLPPHLVDAAAAPVDGVKALLVAAGLAWRETTVDKARLQAAASALVPSLTPGGVDREWLAELAIIETSGITARTLCFERVSRAAVPSVIQPGGDARNLGYPAFLIDALRRSSTSP